MGLDDLGYDTGFVMSPEIELAIVKLGPKGTNRGDMFIEGWGNMWKPSLLYDG